jgi:hypothetical protein
MTGQCFARCPVPASIPSVVRMVCRDGVLQHPPFGGGTPVAMGDAQWPARSEVSPKCPIFLVLQLTNGCTRACAGLSGREPVAHWKGVSTVRRSCRISTPVFSGSAQNRVALHIHVIAIVFAANYSSPHRVTKRSTSALPPWLSELDCSNSSTYGDVKWPR